MQTGDASAPEAPADGAKPQPFEAIASRHFGGWLTDNGVSLACTTYQANLMFFIGADRDGRWSMYWRLLKRCMGLVAHGNSLYISTLYQSGASRTCSRPARRATAMTASTCPRSATYRRSRHARSAVDAAGRLIFVNTCSAAWRR